MTFPPEELTHTYDLKIKDDFHWKLVEMGAKLKMNWESLVEFMIEDAVKSMEFFEDNKYLPQKSDDPLYKRIQSELDLYGSLSDIKLKENVVDASSQWSDIKSLQIRKYNFKEGQTHTQIGLIAQEVELVSPGLVYESPDRDADGNDLGTVTKSVNYSVLYMKAVKALQEAMERIEQLETEMAEVKAQLS